MRLITALLGLAGVLSLPVSAHQLWIEQENGNAKLYFGEYGDNLRETSPGSLDKLPQPEAQVVTLEGSDPLTVKKTANAFDLGVRVTRGQVILAQESRHPAWDKKDGDTVARTVWIPAARYVPDLGPQEPALALDVFPTRNVGEFKVVFIGNPLAGAKVEVVAASGWTRTLKSDDQGLVRVDLPWKGPYAVEVRHTDKRPGERPGASGPEKYDVAMFVTTLTFDQPTGPKAPPALPPAKPAP
ncbi:hypothetical protein [Rhizobacter sp. Root1221]|uniref:hypothetical protein n=1 Tax=Rhizobacter sp. Root1221 TaxID=1736433 RepID=UPI0006F7BBCE|nr:hypothetical protein [Rhizobacter sp. Root1221]KQV96987.1 hypothetical protein ASC87_24245 [Rhizobacter sp. Root1221]